MDTDKIIVSLKHFNATKDCMKRTDLLEKVEVLRQFGSKKGGEAKKKREE